MVVDVFSNEKDIEKEIIFQAIESALESATVSRYAFPILARVSLLQINIAIFNLFDQPCYFPSTADRLK
jgi:hypothetical protein